MRTTYTYDRANRLKIAVANGVTTTYTHDPAGHRTGETSPSQSVTYHWDAGGRMHVVEADAGTTTFTYDADGRRIVKQDAHGSPTGFLYDDKKLVAETDQIGGQISHLYATTADGEYGDLIGDDGAYAHQYDAQSATTCLTDNAGAVQAAYKYYAFGHVAAFAVDGDGWQSVAPSEWAAGDPTAWADLPPELNTRMLAGGKKQYYFDPETRLHLLGTGTNGRYYDAATGRFTSEDPIRQAGGDHNLYRYVENSPVDQLDPSGHSTKDEEERKRQEAERQRRAAEDKLKQENLANTRATYESAKNKAHDAGDSKAESQLWSKIQLVNKQEHLADLEVRRDYDADHGGQYQGSLSKDIQAAHQTLADTIADAGKISGWDYTKAYTGGFVEGAQGGISIASSTLSHGLTDKVGVTNSDQYQGKDYASSRVAAKVSSVALETAGALGLGALAQGGIKGTSIVARTINAAAQSEKLVQGAKIVDTASTVYGTGESVVQAGRGVAAIADKPTDWHGYAQAAIGVGTSLLSVKGAVAGVGSLGGAAGGAERKLALEANQAASEAKGLASAEANVAKAESKASSTATKASTEPATPAATNTTKPASVEASKAPKGPTPSSPAAGQPEAPASASTAASHEPAHTPSPTPSTPAQSASAKPTAPSANEKAPVIGEVRPYNKAKANKYEGYDDHHLDPPLGRKDPGYSTGPTIPVRNDNAGGKVAGGLNYHTGPGGFQQALDQHIKDLGYSRKSWNALPDNTRLTHLRRYYSSFGIPFPG